MRRLRVYVASSWKNGEKVRGLAGFLREDFGYEVFDFTDGEKREDGFDRFVFNSSQWFMKPKEEIDWLEFLDDPVTVRCFKSDKAGIDWADVVIMIAPCGRNAHLEAGYAVGCGKPLFIYGELPRGEFEVMYHFASGCFREKDLAKMLSKLDVIDKRVIDRGRLIIEQFKRTGEWPPKDENARLQLKEFM